MGLAIDSGLQREAELAEQGLLCASGNLNPCVLSELHLFRSIHANDLLNRRGVQRADLGRWRGSRLSRTEMGIRDALGYFYDTVGIRSPVLDSEEQPWLTQTQSKRNIEPGTSTL